MRYLATVKTSVYVRVTNSNVFGQVAQQPGMEILLFQKHEMAKDGVESNYGRVFFNYCVKRDFKTSKQKANIET